MQLTDSRELERGDTIIEVVLAFVVFAMATVLCLSAMNQSVAVGERALETTLVRQQINAQAEALRYIHEARVVDSESEVGKRWQDFLTTYRQASASPYGTGGTNECRIPTSGYKPFVLNARKAEIWGTPAAYSNEGPDSPPYSQVVYDSTGSSVKSAYGIWVEAVPTGAPVSKFFIDFHIRACWPAPGSAVPMTLGTIVRLYDPA